MWPGKKISSFTREEVSQLFNRVHPKVKIPGLRILRGKASLEFGRILIVTPRKVGSAPERNLIRRRIKAIFTEHKLYQRHYDGIALIGRDATKLSYQDLIRYLHLVFPCA